MCRTVFFCLALTLFPGSLPAPVLKPEDAGWIGQMEKAAFHGFGKLLDPITRFPVDGAPVSQGNVVRLSRSVRFNKTSPAHIAFAFFYQTLSAERGWIPRKQAYENLSELLDNLGSLETHEGFLYQWYALSGRPEEWPRVIVNRFVPLYENALLDAAMMCAAGAFPSTALERDIDRRLAKKDYGFFAAPSPSAGGVFLRQGFDAARGGLSESEYSIFAAPSRIAVLLAVLKDGVPEDVWKNQDRLVRDYEMLDGSRAGVLASWSGGLAETLLADEILGGDRIAPGAFAAGAQAMIRIQKDKGQRLSESGIWGFSSGEAPDQGRYEPMGVAEAAYQRSGPEFVTPYSVLLAFRYDLEGVLANLRTMQSLNPAVFGPRYGFADSMDPVTGVVNRNILALDKGVEFLALANFQSRLEGGRGAAEFLWAYFKKRGWEKKAMDLLKAEEGFPQYAALDPLRPAVKSPPEEAAEPLDLLKQSRDIGTFYDPERSKAVYRMVQGPEGRTAIGIRYDVTRPAAYSGLYVKLRDSDYSRYRSLQFRLKGSSERGYPNRVKVEIKHKGQNVQFAQVMPAADWQEVRIPLPRFMNGVDEIAFVFDNGETGKNRRGEILLEALTLN